MVKLAKLRLMLRLLGPKWNAVQGLGLRLLAG
jgi:hypothetical protein